MFFFFHENYFYFFMFRNVPECSGVFLNVPFSEFYRRPNDIASRFFKLQYGLVSRHFSSVSGEYSKKKIPEKSFDIFGTIKTIGLKERIHSHDQSKREVFSRTVSYKEEIHCLILRSKLYHFRRFKTSFLLPGCIKLIKGTSHVREPKNVLKLDSRPCQWFLDS